jgi:hypothetical protein
MRWGGECGRGIPGNFSMVRGVIRKGGAEGIPAVRHSGFGNPTGNTESDEFSG